MKTNQIGLLNCWKLEIIKSTLEGLSSLGAAFKEALGPSAIELPWEKASLYAHRHSLFTGWLNNRMTSLLMLVESRKPRERKTILRIQFFLEDLRHHYLPSEVSDSVEEAFYYLEHFFTDYPAVSIEQSETAIEMVNRIYVALGYPEKVRVQKTAREKLSTHAPFAKSAAA